MARISIVSIDFQNEFTAKGGVCYKPRESTLFVKEKLVPLLRKSEIKIAEIISDYRQPRPGDRGDCNHPGTWGYESEIPKDMRFTDQWIKCMNSPIWTRKNIGEESKKPGLPYQDPTSFQKWLLKTIGSPSKAGKIILIGLTLDCCVLSTAQELNWRAYDVYVLSEAVDTYSGSKKEKKYLLKNPPLTNWAEPISFRELRPLLSA